MSSIRAARCAFLWSMAAAGLASVATPSRAAATYTVLYSFLTGAAGTGVTLDPSGTLYGVNSSATPRKDGLAFALTPPAAEGARWTATPLTDFGGPDGAYPMSVLVEDSSGALYGTTSYGGYNRHCAGDPPVVDPGCGVVFKLTPPGAGSAAWSEQVLYRFYGGKDGALPLGDLTRDSSGALYGTTVLGGGARSCQGGCGTVYELTPPAGGGTPWIRTVLHAFTGTGEDGLFPSSGLLADGGGGFYGTTPAGGGLGTTPCGSTGCGTVFRLTAPAGAGTPWTETVIYRFGLHDGHQPEGKLAEDPDGALYGTTESGGASDFGAVFKLAPPPAGRVEWTETVIHSFTMIRLGVGMYPRGGLIRDSSGALYGANSSGGSNADVCGIQYCGTVFKLTPPAGTNGAWTAESLHWFRFASGGVPIGGLVADANGALYGTTVAGGSHEAGTVFRITP